MAKRDLVSQFDREGIRTAVPGPKMARSRLPFVRKCLEEALAGRRISSLGQLPQDEYLASRKLARYFVLLEGAYVLMARGAFQSFRQEAVLAGLRKITRRWRPLLRTTEAILADPHKAAVQPREILRMLRPFVEWGLEVTEASQGAPHA